MRAWMVLLLLPLAGCLGDEAPTSDPDPTGDPVPPRPTHAVHGLVEPVDLVAPTFRLLGAVAQGGPAYAMGEPGIWAGLDGTLLVAIPGCDNLSLFLDGCAHGQLWRSDDDGVTWQRMNQAEGGRLTAEGPEANGDADVAMDAAGNIYVSNLGGGIQVHTYWAETGKWEYMANIVPEGEGADRQWVAAASPGHAIHAWMRTSPERDVEINTTFDGGRTWTGSSYFGDSIGWVGTPQFAADGLHAYVPYTQPTGATADALVAGAGDTFEMHVIRTTDGGITWADVATGLVWKAGGVNVHWSGGYMAPTLDVTGDGTVVVGMAVDQEAIILGGNSATNWGTRFVWATSTDAGINWTIQEPLARPTLDTLNQYDNVVMPWIAGGAGDRFAVTYYRAIGGAQADAAGTIWNLEASYFDRQDDGTYRVVHAVVDDDIHEGPLCNRGGSCAFPVDRTLLDYHESDLLPDGRLAITYAADPWVENQRNIQVRVAIQEGGSLLGVPQAL